MKLDTVEQRQKLVDDLKNASAKFRDIVEEDEDDHDWGGATVLFDDFDALVPLVAAEQIFIEALDEIRNNDHKDREIFSNIMSNQLDLFIRSMIMHSLNHTVDNLHDWGFRSETGKKYYRSTHKKLDALVEKYQDLYDL